MGRHAADVPTAFVLAMDALPKPVRPSVPIAGTLAAAIAAIATRRLRSKQA